MDTIGVIVIFGDFIEIFNHNSSIVIMYPYKHAQVLNDVQFPGSKLDLSLNQGPDSNLVKIQLMIIKSVSI